MWATCAKDRALTVCASDSDVLIIVFSFGLKQIWPEARCHWGLMGETFCWGCCLPMVPGRPVNTAEYSHDSDSCLERQFSNGLTAVK